MITENKEVLVILGNGFDLDLGLKTHYKNFLDSTYFTDNLSGLRPVLNIYDADINLFDYLKEEEINGWIDFENSLAKLATRHVRKYHSNQDLLPHVSSEEVKTYQLLKVNLTNYLKDIDYTISPDNLALKLLHAVDFPNNCSEVINFNYTDAQKIYENTFRKSADFSMTHIHGDLWKGNNKHPGIILGFQDNVDIDDSYCFMIKSHDENYRSIKLRNKLKDAEEVIFFGHSLGTTDYHYFEQFFKDLCEKESDKIVRIFTKDEGSRLQTMIQLRNMNNKRTTSLFENCDFAIYRTDGTDRDLIETYLSELNDRNISRSANTTVTSAFI